MKTSDYPANSRLGAAAAARRAALREVANYMIEGPAGVLSPGTKDNERTWLDSAIALSQFILAKGPLEARSLYTARGMMATSKLLPVVRQLVWQRSADRKRTFQGVVERPDLNVIFYQLEESELIQLDGLIKGLDAALTSLPVHLEKGLDLAELYQEEDPKRFDKVKVPEEGAYPHRRWLFRESLLSFQLQWLEGDAPEFDEAWQEVWDALGACCREQRRVEGYSEEYWLDPDEYARLLTSTLS